MNAKLHIVIALTVASAAGMSMAACSADAPVGHSHVKPSEESAASNAHEGTSTPSPEKVIECMKARGYRITYSTLDKSFTMDSKTATHSEVSKDFAHCKAIAGYRAIAKFSLSQKAYLYGRTVKLQKCLEARGYKMPTMPSRKQFIESYQNHPYLPYAFLPKVTEKQFRTLEKECPQPDL